VADYSDVAMALNQMPDRPLGSGIAFSSLDCVGSLGLLTESGWHSKVGAGVGGYTCAIGITSP
jgi:hypothetical protein